MTTNLLIRNVRPMAGSNVDILIENGRITRVEPELSPLGGLVEDGGGRIVVPGLVEAHTHLDKSMIGMAWYRNEVGPRLIDKIETEREAKIRLGIDPVRQSRRQALASVAQGTTHIRSHVDIDTVHGLAGVEGVMRTRDELRDLVDIEIVAFPQGGMMIRPGTIELMRRALEMGAEVVGGLDPAGVDRDPKGHLDAIFDLAQRFGRPIDIHLHEAGELGAFSLELIIERTRALGMQGRVAVSHAFCLGMHDADYVGRLIDELAELSIHILTTGPASQPSPPVAKLRSAGVVVGAGNDGIRDIWGPYGSGDMLERAMFVGLRNNFRRDDELEWALDVCTRGGAGVLALERYGLMPGCWGDMVLVEGETLADAVVSHRPRALVVKRGKVVARGGVAVQTSPAQMSTKTY
ncbi:amidohydrolase family protein [Mesorhizobium sp. M0088]|uniref:amidohydrolase family protein n=1 Tax=Mesorhizobium sp. M0088 TaxID=2956873 RepID=UPI0033379BB4